MANSNIKMKGGGERRHVSNLANNVNISQQWRKSAAVISASAWPASSSAWQKA